MQRVLVVVCRVGAVILYVACLDFLLSDMEFDGDAFQCHLVMQCCSLMHKHALDHCPLLLPTSPPSASLSLIHI